MGNDDEGADPLRGFAEANTAFERLTKVKMMDDATLLERYRALSYQHIVKRTAWLELIEAEVKARGLVSKN